VEKRTDRYMKEDWAKITAKNDCIHAKIIAAMDRGPTDPQVQEGVAELRQYITDHFYECTPDIFRGLGDLYVTDERFTANLDKNSPGYTAFLREAMNVYCDRLTSNTYRKFINATSCLSKNKQNPILAAAYFGRDFAYDIRQPWRVILA
jgi:hypothetical protein